MARGSSRDNDRYPLYLHCSLSIYNCLITSHEESRRATTKIRVAHHRLWQRITRIFFTQRQVHGQCSLLYVYLSSRTGNQNVQSATILQSFLAYSSRDQDADKGNSFKHVFGMRGTRHVFRQILASNVFALVVTFDPEKIVRNIVYLSFVSNVCWSSIFSIVLLQLIKSELFLRTQNNTN